MPDVVTLQESAGLPNSAAAVEAAAPVPSGGHVVDLTSAPSPAQPHRNAATSSEVPQDSASSTTSQRRSTTRKVKVRALRRRRGRRAVESEGEGSSDEGSKGAPSITDNSDESEDEEDGDSDEGESSDDSDEDDAEKKDIVPASSSSVNLSATLASNGTAPTSPANTSTAASKESIEPSKWSDVMDQEDQVRSPSAQPPSAQQNAPPPSKRALQRQAARERAAAPKVAASDGRSPPSPTTPSTADSRGPAVSSNPAGPAPRTRPPKGPKLTNASARGSNVPPSAPRAQRGSGPRGGNSHVKGSGMARRGLMSWGSDDDVLEGGVEETPNAAVANSASASESIVRLPPSAPRALRKKEAEKRIVQTAASEPVTTAISQKTSAQAPALETPDSSAKWGHEGFQELLAAGDRRARGRGRNGRGRGHAATPGLHASSGSPPPGTPTGPSSQKEVVPATHADLGASSADANPREAAQALHLPEEDSGVRVRVPPTSRSVQVPVAAGNHSPAPLGMAPVPAPSPLPFGHSPLASPAIRSLPPGFMMDATGYVYDCNSGTPVAVGFVPPIVPPQPEQSQSGTTFYYQQSWPPQPAPAPPYNRQIDDGRRLVEPVRVRTPNAIPIKAARAAAFQPVKKVAAVQPSAGVAEPSASEAAPETTSPSQPGSVSPSTARLSYGERVQLMRQQREQEQTQQQAQAQDTQQVAGYRQTQAAQRGLAERSIQIGPYGSPNIDDQYRSYMTADTQPGYYSGYTDPSQYGGGYNPYAVQAQYAAYASGMGQGGGQQSPVPGMYPGGAAYGAEVQQQAYLRDWSRQQEAQAQSYQLAAQSQMGPQNGRGG